MSRTQNHPLIGRWESNERGHPRLEFTADGAVTGSDGCNGIFSTYAANVEGAVIEMFVSTLKACFGVDDWLRGVHTVHLRGDNLVVRNAVGTKIGELHRATAG